MDQAGPQIEEDNIFQQRWWRYERIAWTLMGLFLIAALAGIFGNGYFSSAEKQQGPLKVAYSRFLRYKSPSELKIQVVNSHEGEISLWIDYAYLNRVRIVRIEPDPVISTIDSKGHRYSFKVKESVPVMAIKFHIETDQPGMLRGWLGIDDRPQIELRQFVFP